MADNRTKRRRDSRRKPPVISSPFIPNRGDEISFARQILALCRPMLKTVYKEIVSLYRDNREAVALREIALDAAADDIFAALDALRARFENEFDIMALPIAQEMVERELVSVNRAFPARMREMALKMASGVATVVPGVKLPDRSSGVEQIAPVLAAEYAVPGNIFEVSPNVSIAIKASIQESVSLIKSIPAQYLDRIEGAVMRSMQSGGSTKQLAQEIKSYAKMTARRAKNIALDQTRKTYTSLNIRRFQDAGIKKFKWIHVGGSAKPRHHHITDFPEGLNGGIFSIDDPPVIDPKKGTKGFPAQLPYCRCIMAAVFDED